MKNPTDPVTKEQYPRSASLIQAISDLFEDNAPPPSLPRGIKKIERATLEAVRIEFADRVDEELLSRIAEEEGYSVEKGTFPLRIIKEGAIIARVGSRSDVGGRFDLYIYFFPPEMDKMSVYRKMLAEREGILDSSTRKINLGELHRFNLSLLGLAGNYVRKRYG